MIIANVAAYVFDWQPSLGESPWLLAAIASAFLAGGLLELAVNMLFLWIFAKSIEDTLGRLRFLLFYMLAAVAAAGAQTLLESGSPTPSVGAAGAIAALIGGYALLNPGARVLCFVGIPFFFTFIEVPALIVGAAWFALQALSAIGQPPLAGLAGGLAFGLIAVRIFAHGRASVATDPPQPVY